MRAYTCERQKTNAGVWNENLVLVIDFCVTDFLVGIDMLLGAAQ
jgi:hypothetical protein